MNDSGGQRRGSAPRGSRAESRHCGAGAGQARVSRHSSLGALVTFVVTVADIAILNVGAAFWGLVAGCLVSWLLERPDFGTLGKA